MGRDGIVPPAGLQRPGLLHWACLGRPQARLLTFTCIAASPRANGSLPPGLSFPRWKKRRLGQTLLRVPLAELLKASTVRMRSKWSSEPLSGKLGSSPPLRGLPRRRSGKESSNAGDVGDTASIPGLGRSPGEGNGNPLQYSCLENPKDRGAWLATVHGVAKNQT